MRGPAALTAGYGWLCSRTVAGRAEKRQFWLQSDQAWEIGTSQDLQAYNSAIEAAGSV